MRKVIIDSYIPFEGHPFEGIAQVVQLPPEAITPDAVRDAKVNARLNSAENTEFICCDAGDFMAEMKDCGEKFNVVFLDPPRAGSDRKFLSSLVHASPERVVYISCNPETQRRDLFFLTKNGYNIAGEA